MRSPNSILPAVPLSSTTSYQQMSLGQVELRDSYTRYISKNQELTGCQFGYVQGRFRR
jgi:hypothetical protein